MLADAPRMADHLDAASVAHGERVQAGLRAARASTFEVDETLVRGLDYYTHTLFEFQSSALEQRPVHDPRRRSLRRPHRAARRSAHARASGFGCGIERVLLACDAEGVFDAPESRGRRASSSTPPAARSPTALTPGRCATPASPTDRAFDARSMKSQMKAAGKSGARFAVIVGEDEKAAGTVTIRDLDGGRADHRRPRDVVVDHIRKVLDA